MRSNKSIISFVLSLLIICFSIFSCVPQPTTPEISKPISFGNNTFDVKNKKRLERKPRIIKSNNPTVKLLSFEESRSIKYVNSSNGFSTKAGNYGAEITPRIIGNKSGNYEVHFSVNAGPTETWQIVFKERNPGCYAKIPGRSSMLYVPINGTGPAEVTIEYLQPWFPTGVYDIEFESYIDLGGNRIQIINSLELGEFTIDNNISLNLVVTDESENSLSLDIKKTIWSGDPWDYNLRKVSDSGTAPSPTPTSVPTAEPTPDPDDPPLILMSMGVKNVSGNIISFQSDVRSAFGEYLSSAGASAYCLRSSSNPIMLTIDKTQLEDDDYIFEVWLSEFPDIKTGYSFSVGTPDEVQFCETITDSSGNSYDSCFGCPNGQQVIFRDGKAVGCEAAVSDDNKFRIFSENAPNRIDFIDDISCD